MNLDIWMSRKYKQKPQQTETIHSVSSKTDTIQIHPEDERENESDVYFDAGEPVNATKDREG
jgi:hypothetical protein